jgi:hypothetical protein
MCDWFFNRYVTPQMKKSIMTLLAGWLTTFFLCSAIRTVLSACFFYRQVIIDHGCRSAVFTHHSQSNSFMRNSCGLIIYLYLWLYQKLWKRTQKYLKICFGNPKYFRSSILNPVYLSLISWHYPFKKLCNNICTTPIQPLPEAPIFCH